MVMPHLSAAILMSFWVSAAAPADGNTYDPVAHIVILNGAATITHTHAGGTQEAATLGTALHESNRVATDKKSAMRILMRDQSVLDLGAESVIAIETFHRSTESHVSVRLTTFLGRLWSHIRPREKNENSFEVRTANAIAGVRGTSFLVDVSADNTTKVSTLTGHVELTPPEGLTGAPQQLGPLQSSTLEHGVWPPPISPITPQQAQEIKQSLTPHTALSMGSGSPATTWSVPPQHAPPPQPPPLVLPLQQVPTPTPTTSPVLNLDPTSHPVHVHATVDFQP